jgi:hypothetical protein
LVLVWPTSIADTLTVRALKYLIENRLHEELGEAQTITEVHTADGFLVSPKEKVFEVFNDNDVIICKDMKYFKELHYNFIETDNLWLEVTRDDFKDNTAKWAQVGGHKHGKMFVRLGHGNFVDKLFVFSKHDLLDRLEGKQPLGIGSVVEDSWSIDATFVQEPDNKLSVALTVKTGSHPKPWCDKVFIKVPIEGYKIQSGDQVVHVSGDDNEGDEDDFEAVYKIPEPKRTGNDIYEPTGLQVTTYSDEGDSPLSIVRQPEKKVEANQQYYATDGKFKNYFTVPELTISNKSGDTLSVVSTTMEYEDSDKSWKPCTEVAIGTSYNGYYGREYQWFENGTSFNMEKNETINLSVSGAVTVTGTPGSTNFLRARAHQSLPQPLKLRVTMTDINGKQKSIVVEQLNRSLDLYTKDSVKSSWSLEKDIDYFVYCDNTDTLDRTFVALYRANENELTIRLSSGYYYTWDKKTIKSYAYSAKEKNVSELELPDMSSDSIKLSLLVDLERTHGYALRIQLQTGTGSVDETVLLPPLKK